MDRISTDILIAGGGVAGLTAAAVFGARGFDVICVEPTTPPPSDRDDSADLRSTAFLEPAISLMADAGLWSRLSEHATDLRVMRLVDAGGADPEPREVADFTAEEMGRPRFGANIPNWLLRREIFEHLDALPNVDLLSGRSVRNVLGRTTGAIVTLDDGCQIKAQLVIAADGRNSRLREAAGIPVRKWDFGQRAMVFAVSHPIPHENISTEIHRTGGPLTFVPLPDKGGVPHSAVVWMETGPEAMALADLQDAEFEAALNRRSCGVLGPLALASRRAVWPIINQIASRMAGTRLALVAETAHVVPPIGAQGLNMSLADVSCLADLTCSERDKGRDFGTDDLLDRYHRKRHPDILARVTGVDLLNRAAMAEAPELRDLRRAGLRLLAGTPPLKSAAMILGLGA